VTPRRPHGPRRWVVESTPAVPAAPMPALAGQARPRPTSRLPCTRESANRLRVSTPPGWPDVSSLRPGPAGPDPPAPPPPEGATMRHRAPVWPPQAGISGAAAPRNRGPLPPVCPPPANSRRQPASTSPGGRQIPPVSAASPLFPPPWITGTPQPSHECASQAALLVLKFQTDWSCGAVQQRCCGGSAPQKLLFVRSPSDVE
jgi:hypothetical protein